MAKRVNGNILLNDARDEHFDTYQDKVAKPASKNARPDAMTAVVGAEFDVAVSKEIRRRLTHPRRASAVVVLVPTSAWVAPTTVYFRTTFGERWTRHVRDVSNRSTHKSSVGSDEVAADLSRGRCVVGVAADVGIRDRVERDLQDLQRRADWLIRRQRKAVVAVATALVERRYLSRDAVREIFEANAVTASGIQRNRRSKKC
jgi:hypothetical protein